MDQRHGGGRGRPSGGPCGARRGAQPLFTTLLALMLAALMAAAALACGEADDGSATGPEPQPPAPSIAADGAIAGADIAGPVASIAVYDASPQGGTGPALALLIEDGSGEYDTASITTTTETAWYEVTSGGLAGLGTTPDAVALTGRSVAVAFVGPVAESYPVQATAGWVVLLPAASIP